ncbi:MAG: hypothetical protein KAG10_00885 [Methylococcales bacterium]|nr:hypothetical protein [Methylococcales bacterium]MCK5924427.1 hypothetical protein [Methylococcales bacterium]
MNLSRATVYIPLVELTDQPNQLLEIYCDGQSEWDKKSLDKDWHFVVSPLRPFGLYEEGLKAVNSVHKLSLKIPFWALYQRFKRYSWLDTQRLHCVNILDFEGESMQLGLAIALLMNSSRSPIRYTIATGKLSNDTQKDYDVAVDTVNGIPQKLQLLLEKRQSNALPRDFLYCFTPYEYLHNGKRYPVNNLPEVKALAALNIQVKPIRWLSDAAKILHADESHFLPEDKSLLVSTSIIAILFIWLTLHVSWLNYPIHIDVLRGKEKNEPFLVCTNRDETEVQYYDLKRDGSVALLPILADKNQDYNLGIGWKIKPLKTPLTSLYYIALIDVGEKAAYKIITHDTETQQAITVAADDVFQWYWPMEEEINKTYEEERVLMIAMQRTPIAAEDIYQLLIARFPESESLKVLEVRDFLTTQFPGSYAFAYKSIFSSPPCVKSMP